MTMGISTASATVAKWRTTASEFSLGERGGLIITASAPVSRANFVLHIPHLQRLVIRCGNGTPPIPTQRHAPDPVCVALEGAQLAPRLHIPHLQLLVIRGGNCAPPVPAQRHASDRACVAPEGAPPSRNATFRPACTTILLLSL